MKLQSVSIFLPWLLIILPMFGMQLQLTFTLLLLITGWRLWFGGKNFLIRLKKVLATLVCTFLLYGVLNLMVFLFVFLFVSAVVFFLQWWRLSLNPLDLRALSYRGMALSNVSLLDDKADNLLQSNQEILPQWNILCSFLTLANQLIKCRFWKYL